MKIAAVTTFANKFWKLYAEQALISYVKFWPKEIPIIVQIEDDTLVLDLQKILRPGDAINVGISEDHKNFIERNKDKDDTKNYRKQAVRFCHKVFCLESVLTAIKDAEKGGAKDTPRYLLWIDADVITTKNVTEEDIVNCLPKEGDAVAYLGRKDWEHSECGWLAFDLSCGGNLLINDICNQYKTDKLFELDQWHDSYIFDVIRERHQYKATNLTEGKPGMDIWPESPMSKFSIHFKGPVAKGLGKKSAPITIQTKNSRPNEEIKANITENQKLIKNWVRTCRQNREKLIVVSAGPTLVAENVKKEAKGGKKIIAVKHALKTLKNSGIKPWACILLDPRPRVNAFVENPDKEILWFVASQVEPSVTKTLLDAGCTVWGYHAAVGADEDALTDLQPDSIVTGGSATATRGLFLLNKLGFSRFSLYGYDLSYTDKPNMDEHDELGQPKYFEVSITANHKYYKTKKTFFSSPELIAQYQEMNDIITKMPWEIEAYGDGIIPFMSEAKKINDLRETEKRGKMAKTKLPKYQEIIKWNN